MIWLGLALVGLWWGGGTNAQAGLPKLQWHLDKPKDVLFKAAIQIFARPEWMTNRSESNSSTEDSDFYVAYRIRLTGDLSYKRMVGFRATLMESGYWGNGLPGAGGVRHTTNSSIQYSRETFFGLQMYEAFLYMSFAEANIRLDVGRMRLVYGDVFLFGDPGFVPPGQSFDGMRMRWKPASTFQLDALWLLVRESVATNQIDDCQGRCYWEGDHMAGLYATFKIAPAHQTDLYGFYYQRAPRSNALGEQTQMVLGGVRYKLTMPRLWLHAEWQIQVGRHQEKALLATAGVLRGRYTFATPLGFFVGGQFLFASGDGDPNDENDNNFLPFFNNRRLYYGYVNLFGLSNILSPMVRVGLKPHKTLTLSLDGRFIMKMNPKGTMVAGGSHNPGLADLTGDDGMEVGTEIDFRAAYRPLPGMLFDLGAGIFLPAKELHQRTAAGITTKTWGTDPSFMVFLNIKLDWK
jgi:hypothetical protein